MLSNSVSDAMCCSVRGHTATKTVSFPSNYSMNLTLVRRVVKKNREEKMLNDGQRIVDSESPSPETKTINSLIDSLNLSI